MPAGKDDKAKMTELRSPDVAKAGAKSGDFLKQITVILASTT